MATTTPNYGWDVPTSTDYVKDGATAIETLGDDIDASLFSITGGKGVGLQFLASQTLTTASTVTFTGAFSADYDIYLLTYNGKAASAGSGFLRMTLGSTVTGYYYNLFDGRSGAGSVAVQLQASNTSFITISPNWDISTSCQTWIGNPFRTVATTISSQFAAMDSAPVSTSGNAGGALNNSTSFTAFTIVPSTSTMTGTFRLYGLRNAS